MQLTILVLLTCLMTRLGVDLRLDRLPHQPFWVPRNKKWEFKFKTHVVTQYCIVINVWPFLCVLFNCSIRKSWCSTKKCVWKQLVKKQMHNVYKCETRLLGRILDGRWQVRPVVLPLHIVCLVCWKKPEYREKTHIPTVNNRHTAKRPRPGSWIWNSLRGDNVCAPCSHPGI